MNGGVFMRGTWKWAAAILAAIAACAWIFSLTNQKPGVDPLQAAYGAQGSTVCWNVDGKFRCSTATAWSPSMPFERTLMEMSLRSR